MIYDNRNLIEMHAHSLYGSCDAYMSPVELVDSMSKAGYAGLVLTNHFDYAQIFKYCDIEPKCERRSKLCGEICLIKSNPFNSLGYDTGEYRMAFLQWMTDYYAAKKYGDSIGFKVYFGCEYSSNEMHLSILGVTAEEFRDSTLLPNNDVNYIRSVFPNSTIIQNHPNRNLGTVLPYSEIDGYETHNTKTKRRHAEVNFSAISHIEDFNKGIIPNDIIKIIGGDIHRIDHIGRSGMKFNEIPTDEIELAEMLIAKSSSIWCNI